MSYYHIYDLIRPSEFLEFRGSFKATSIDAEFHYKTVR